ncbi:MAG: HPr family phosphocarrier protein [Coxiellaceae bacterium]|nr:HPr family phosphocarrier protein [Coxiellaceae bacterium]
MQEKKLTIVNKLGLHARAAMKFSDLAMRYHSSCYISFNGRRADAKSIMEVMVVGATQGKEVELIVEGDDEEAAISALAQLINDRFGEDE